MVIPPGLSSNSIKRLLFEAQPYVEQHGFRIEAIRAAITSKNLMDENGQTIEQNDIPFNFSSQADITKQLLSIFDQQSLQKSSNSLQPSKDKEGNLEKVELLLAGKLLQSASIRDQLVDALAILTGSANKTFIPGISLPLPIIQRAWGVIDEAVYMANYKGKLRTDWYTHRTRLSNAFMLSELHLLSPDFNGDVHQSLHVLRKLARPNQLFGLETVQSTSEWVNWGAKGWLGIFRSLGL